MKKEHFIKLVIVCFLCGYFQPISFLLSKGKYHVEADAWYNQDNVFPVEEESEEIALKCHKHGPNNTTGKTDCLNEGGHHGKISNSFN